MFCWLKRHILCLEWMEIEQENYVPAHCDNWASKWNFPLLVSTFLSKNGEKSLLVFHLIAARR